MRDIAHDSRALLGCDYFVWISRRKNLYLSARQCAFLNFEGTFEGTHKCGHKASLGFLQPSM